MTLDINGIWVSPNPTVAYSEVGDMAMAALARDILTLGIREALRVHLTDPQMITPEYVLDPLRAAFLDGMERRRKTTRAIDLGCGLGSITHALADRYDTVTAVDASYGRLLVAKRWLDTEHRNNVEFVCSNLGEYSLEPDSCDLVVLNGVLEWVPLEQPSSAPGQTQADLLRRVFHALRPGGTLYVGIENRYALYALAG